MIRKFYDIELGDKGGGGFDELDAEAKVLLEKFRFRSIGENNYDYAKQCAVIHCELMVDKLKNGLDYEMKKSIAYYIAIKEKIQSL